MILIGLGANLPSPRYGTPKRTLEAALGELEARGIRIVRRSRWYSTAPVPASDQPRYVNGVAAVETRLGPVELLGELHDIEREFGRERGARDAARMLDLDLLAYDDLVRTDAPPLLPHPRLAQRAFVLRPLCDVAPQWRHPVLGRTAAELASQLGADADIQLLDEPAN